MGDVKRIGLALLSNDRMSEADFQRVFATRGGVIHSARMWYDLDLPQPARMDRVHEELAMASRYVGSVGLDAIVYSCTTGSFYRGVGWDKEMERIMEEASGAPAFATSPSAVEALNELGAKKVSVVTPYPNWNNQLLAPYLEAKGFEVLNLDGHPKTGSGQVPIPDHDPEEIVEFGVAKCHPDADVLFCSCTDWGALEVVERLEALVGKPVVTANQATIWLVARQLGIPGPIDGFGSLLRDRLAMVPA